MTFSSQLSPRNKRFSPALSPSFLSLIPPLSPNTHTCTPPSNSLETNRGRQSDARLHTATSSGAGAVQILKSQLTTKCTTQNHCRADFREIYGVWLLEVGAGTISANLVLQWWDQIQQKGRLRFVGSSKSWSILQNIVCFIGLFCKRDL